MKIIRTREFGKEFRSLFREVCLTLEFQDGQIWLENVALQRGWQTIWGKVKGTYVEMREKCCEQYKEKAYQCFVWGNHDLKVHLWLRSINMPEKGCWRQGTTSQKWVDMLTVLCAVYVNNTKRQNCTGCQAAVN